ncbi:MAG: chromosome segregation protein SMC [Desulfuromonadales bacterium]|nr:chromosome segregation protein SMC [Desulfuromonadales bacterium]
MKIKRLEITGFKSFADRVVLDFQQGVTGVVGPNGCGKSNIVDSIRWCMGEQSAKNLRGKAMEDIIFVGSETRKPLGMAEVSLVFSTEDGRAPAKYLDYAEIQLTRRLYRDGESDYLINKTPCRLMDITELFMDTGVGTRAYSIIEQGKIGMILHSRPEERRFLIEEAAGVTKFKSRKQQALKKIEGTRLNLARLADVLGEIKRQLASLQRQAKKAEKFREYRDELREIELLFTAHEYRTALAQRRSAESDQATLNERIRDVFSASALSESRIEGTRLQLVEAEKNLATNQEEIYRIRNLLSTTESGLEFQRKELSSLTGRISRLESESGELGGRLRECAAQRQLLEQRRDSSSSEAEALQTTLTEEETALTGHQRAEQELLLLLEGKRKELFSALSESAQYKNRLESSRKQLTALDERLERHGRERIQLAERLELNRRRAAEVNGDISRCEGEQEVLQVEVSTLRRREDDLKIRLPEQEALWQKQRDELNRASSRLHSLQELEAQFAGYGRGVKSLMQSPELRPRFSGLLADCITAPRELETALEAALADRLQCVLCSDERDAVQALEFLKNNNGGRAGLALPLPGEPSPAPGVTGALPLENLIQVSGPHGGLIRQILKEIMLVDNLPQAMELARNHPDLSFVTRDGDMVALGGVLTGGSPEQIRQGIIHKKREIRELEVQTHNLDRLVAELGAERDRLRLDARNVGEELKNSATLLHQAELKLAGLRKDHQRASDEIIRTEERLEVQTLEAASLSEERDTLDAEQRLAEGKLTEIGETTPGLEQDASRFKGELENCREQLSLLRERVTTIRVQVATLKEQREASLSGIADLDRQSHELTRRMTSDHGELEQGQLERSKLQESIASLTERLEELVRTQDAEEKRFAETRLAYEAASHELTAAESDAKKIREENDAVRQVQADLNLRFSTLAMQIDHLERSLLEKHRIELSDALTRLEATEFDQPSRQERQSELRRLLDDMGEVNLMAIDEYATMEERFSFLTSQKDDLEESLRSLQQAIQRINRTTRQRFLETYNLVNAKFQEVFPRLFCGGKAELRLTNEDDLLETGIDIIVQPPGKKLQNVTLLSGGEKALTAVALIFSIFLIKPTPFCLLDEVDAPLDDANIGRFNEMVREMSAFSQFIIITHNKATMQVADTLYGITMESPGSSKVVSVKLH